MSDKKRKWDVASTPNGSTSNPPPSTISGKEDAALAAHLAAQKLTAVLASQQQAPTPTPGKTFEKDIPINEYNSNTRYYLCKGTTHNEIMVYAPGSVVKVKGRYKPPGDTSLDKPLSLQILSDTQESLDIAVTKINEIVRKEQAASNIPPPSGQIAEYLFSEKVLVNMENCDPSYGVNAKILGPNNSFIEHIMKTTGTKVSLRGVGTDDPCNEPMHLLVSSNVRTLVEKGKALCEDLLNHVRTEYYNYVQYQYYNQYQQQYGFGDPTAFYQGYNYGQPGVTPDQYYQQVPPTATPQARPQTPPNNQQNQTPTPQKAQQAPTQPQAQQTPQPVQAQPQQAPQTQQNTTQPVTQSKPAQSANDDLASFYAEIAQLDSTPKIPTVTSASSAPTATPPAHPVQQVPIETRKPLPVKEVVVTKESPKIKEKETEDENATKKAKTEKAPFWASPESEGANPLNAQQKLD